MARRRAGLPEDVFGSRSGYRGHGVRVRAGGLAMKDPTKMQIQGCVCGHVASLFFCCEFEFAGVFDA